jgi:hypothetical protein
VGLAVVASAVPLPFVPLSDAEQSRVIVGATVAAAIAAVGSCCGLRIAHIGA